MSPGPPSRWCPAPPPLPPPPPLAHVCVEGEGAREVGGAGGGGVLVVAAAPLPRLQRPSTPAPSGYFRRIDSELLSRGGGSSGPASGRGLAGTAALRTLASPAPAPAPASPLTPGRAPGLGLVQ